MQKLFFYIVFFNILAFAGLLPANSDLQSAQAAITDGTENSSLIDLDLRVFVAGKPINLILVEKDKQRLRVLKHDGRLRVIGEYTAVTGENPGQKEKEGDSRTPEGIYFITKIYTDSELTIFGKRAFHLDYPNIFDLGAGKGGYGIFIHGTNKELVANSTNGCVTLNNEDLDNLVQYLSIGSTPVIVVSSLKDLNFVDSSDDRIGLFTTNDFQIPKSLFLPEDEEPWKVYFESLYMVSVNSQIVAVGEYHSFENSGRTERGLVRGYLEYSKEDGWAMVESLRLAPRPLPGWAKSDFFDNYLSNIGAAAQSGDLAEVNDLFWQGREDTYLAWYREMAQRTTVDEAIKTKRADSEIVQVQKDLVEARKESRHGLDFFWLFLLTVCMSIGSVWVLIQLRFQQSDRENGTISSLEKEKYQAAVVRVSADISWIKEMLPQLRTKVSTAGMHQKSSAYQVELNKLDQNLQEKQQALDAFATKFKVLQNQEESSSSSHQKELAEVNEKLLEVTGELQNERNQCLELTEKANRFELIENELQEVSQRCVDFENQTVLLTQAEDDLQKSRIEIESITSENIKLKEKATRTEEKEELENLQINLESAKEDLQNALAHRTELEKQVERLVGTGEELSKLQSDIERLTNENEKLKHEAGGEKYKQELADLKKYLEGVEGELKDAFEHRDRLEQQIVRLTESEDDLASRQVKIERIIDHQERHAESLIEEEVEDKAEEGVIPVETVKESFTATEEDDYLPSDVLMKWIGK